MYTFMVDITLPSELDEDFIALVPAQRALSMQMLRERKLLSYSLSMDRSRLWIIAEGRSEADVERLLRKMPLFGYFQFEINPLAFSESPVRMLPELSLN
jgi:muconolactone delta-isomerase